MQHETLPVNLSLTKNTKMPLFVNGFAQVQPNRRRHDRRFLRRIGGDSLEIDMSRELTGGRDSDPRSERRSVASVELLTSAALAVSTAVAMTAVSIGIARADVAGMVANSEGASFAVALCIGLLISALGGLTAIVARAPRRR
jgi:hypothetical protein